MGLTFCGNYVTIGGECFAAFFAEMLTKPRLREDVPTSSLSAKYPLEDLRGEFGVFLLEDNKGAHPNIEVLVGFNDEAHKSLENVSQFVSLCVKRMRRAFDEGELEFGKPLYFVLLIESGHDVDDRPESDERIRQFILHEVYWHGYKLEHIKAVGAVVVDDDNLKYLKVSEFDLKRVLKFLALQGWVEIPSFDEACARATTKLIEAYHSSFREIPTSEKGGNLTQIYNVYGAAGCSWPAAIDRVR